MKIKHITFTIIAIVATLSGCTYDNYDAPNAYLTGRVVYQNEPIGVRSNGVRLELYQRGFALYNKIDLHVAQDGTFSANVFDGDYQITRLQNNGPWANQGDTIKVQVKGNTVVDVPVSPYFLIRNAAYTKNGDIINATFNVERVHPAQALERVNLYINSTTIVDATNQQARGEKSAAAVGTDLSQPVTLSTTLPTILAGRDYVYARIGVKAVGAGELIYSAPQKIMLK